MELRGQLKVMVVLLHFGLFLAKTRGFLDDFFVYLGSERVDFEILVVDLVKCGNFVQLSWLVGEIGYVS